MTTFGDQVYQHGGVPVGIGEDMPWGDVYYVNSDGGDNGYLGKKKGTAKATIEGALSAVSAYDRIYIAPGHTETITGVGGLALDVAGVEIFGLGRYDSRPRFLMDGAATVSCLVTAANMRLSNCVFAAGHADVAVFATISAKGFKLDHCRFENNTTAENFVTVVSAGVADNDYDGLEVIDNVIDNAGDAGELNSIILNKNSESVRIIGNKIYGDYDTTPFAVIYSANTEHHMDIDISYNHIHNLHNADAVVGISVGSTTSTGFMHHNYVYALDTAGETPFVSAATGIALFDNYYTYDGGTTSGLILPAIGTLS